MCDNRVPAISPSCRRPRGGRRPGAGAPTGNLNGLKTGRYSVQLQALQGALASMPYTAKLVDEITARDRRRTEKLAYALQYYGEILLVRSKREAINKRNKSIKKRGVPINENDRVQLRRIMKLANAIKQSN